MNVCVYIYIYIYIHKHQGSGNRGCLPPWPTIGSFAAIR